MPMLPGSSTENPFLCSKFKCISYFIRLRVSGLDILKPLFHLELSFLQSERIRRGMVLSNWPEWKISLDFTSYLNLFLGQTKVTGDSMIESWLLRVKCTRKLRACFGSFFFFFFFVSDASNLLRRNWKPGVAVAESKNRQGRTPTFLATCSFQRATLSPWHMSDVSSSDTRNCRDPNCGNHLDLLPLKHTQVTYFSGSLLLSNLVFSIRHRFL